MDEWFCENKNNWKKEIYKTYIKSGCTGINYHELNDATKFVAKIVNKRKQEYYEQQAKKLSNPKLSTKKFWPILKAISNFKSKVNLFNEFFASECTSSENSNFISNNQAYTTDTKIKSIKFNDDDFIKTIRNLDMNKTHDHDDITIWMIKICDYAIVKPLLMIFKNCISFGEFPDIWKKSSICSIDKKSDKQIINYYRPVMNHE